MEPRKLVANGKNGLGHISYHHKAQGVEFNARVLMGLFGNDEKRMEVSRNSLIRNKDLDVVIINGERIKG